MEGNATEREFVRKYTFLAGRMKLQCLAGLVFTLLVLIEDI